MGFANPWDVAGLGLGAGTGIANAIIEGVNAKKNNELQKENLEWQKGAQDTTWEREDNAVQRRVRDLKAAGLNPALAAGSAAQASAPIHTTAPQTNVSGVTASLGSLGKSLSSMPLMMMELMRGQQNISQSQAETDLIKARAEAQVQQTNYEQIDRPRAILEKELNNRKKELELEAQRAGLSEQQQRIAIQLLDREARQINIDYAKKNGLPVGSQPTREEKWAGAIQNKVGPVVEGAADWYKQKYEEIINRIKNAGSDYAEKAKKWPLVDNGN